MSAAKRKIRMGMVGGGRGAFIGAVHRMAAALDGDWRLVAGAFILASLVRVFNVRAVQPTYRLALLTALVGPYFVNWNDHRAFFEAEASRLIGLNVQVAGPIKVSVLPTPSIT